MKQTPILSLMFCLLHSLATGATVAYYEFDGTGVATVGSTISDLAGSHDGTVQGGSLLYGSDSVVGSYLHFDADGTNVAGAANRVVIPGSADLVFSSTGTFTVETIFRTTQTGTNGVLVSKGCDVTNPDSQWWMRHQGNGLVRASMEGNLGAGAEDTATSASGILYNDGAWHRIAFVYNGTGTTKILELYVDGVRVGSDSVIGTSGVLGGTDSDPVVIGEYATLIANRSFAGDIAALRISDSVLDPAQFLMIPEPSSLSLLAFAGALFAVRRRTRH